MNFYDFIPYIIPGLVIVAAALAFLVSLLTGGEEKKLVTRIISGLLVILIIVIAGVSWYLLDRVYVSHKERMYSMDQNLGLARAKVDSLKSLCDYHKAKTLDLSMVLDVSCAENNSLEKTIEELNKHAEDLDMARKSKENTIAALKRDKSKLKERVVEVAKAAQKKVQIVIDSLVETASVRQENIQTKETESKLTYSISTTDSSGKQTSNNTYYSFFADPPGELKNVSIYFKLDQPFLDIEDISDEVIRNRRSKFFSEMGGTGFFYQIANLAEGEAIIIRISAEGYISPRQNEPPVLYP